MPHTLTVSSNHHDQQHNNTVGATTSGQYGNHLVKARLPNQQRTTVSTQAGMTIKDALTKALKLRKLEPDMCTVFRLRQDGQAKQRINWDVDVSMLKGDEILVETRDKVPMHTQISHDFAKSYLTLSKCHFCHEFLMTGIRCLTCGIEFHRNCSASVPKLCEPAIDHSDYFRHLLARPSGFSPTNALSTSESPTNTTWPLRPRARSADENSKHNKSKTSNHNQNAEATKNNTTTSTSNANTSSDYHQPANTTPGTTYQNHHSSNQIVISNQSTDHHHHHSNTTNGPSVSSNPPQRNVSGFMTPISQPQRNPQQL